MRAFVENQMTDGLKEAELTFDKDILTVKLIHEDLWFKCLIPDELVGYQLFDEGQAIGLNQWYVIEANHEIIQGPLIQQKLWTKQFLLNEGIDINSLKQDLSVKTKSSYYN